MPTVMVAMMTGAWLLSDWHTWLLSTLQARTDQGPCEGHLSSQPSPPTQHTARTEPVHQDCCSALLTHTWVHWREIYLEKMTSHPHLIHWKHWIHLWGIGYFHLGPGAPPPCLTCYELLCVWPAPPPTQHRLNPGSLLAVVVINNNAM